MEIKENELLEVWRKLDSKEKEVCFGIMETLAEKNEKITECQKSKK